MSLGRHTNDTNDVTPCHNKISDFCHDIAWRLTITARESDETSDSDDWSRSPHGKE